MKKTIARTITPVVRPLSDFIKSEQSGGLVMLFASMLALALANSPFAQSFHDLWHEPIAFFMFGAGFSVPLELLVNDGLMAIFFLLVGMEIKREMTNGALSKPSEAFLPILAAVGGMVAPAVIFVLLNQGQSTLSGWAIPTATDIAFSLTVILLVGSRIPFQLKVFLATLAIADDLGAILVIALFYGGQLDVNYLLFAGAIFSFMLLLNYFSVKSYTPYLVLGAALWYLIYKSGVHATLAGVLIALAIPNRIEATKAEILVMLGTLYNRMERHCAKDEEVDTRSLSESIEKLSAMVSSPAQKLENLLHNPVAFFVLPLFALCNTGVHLDTALLGQLAAPLGLGITLGLMLGKPIGIVSLCWLAIRLRWAQLPNNVTFRHLVGAGLLAGIGFTMSIFITMLAFPGQPELQNIAKLAIVASSLLSGLAGYYWLKIASK